MPVGKSIKTYWKVSTMIPSKDRQAEGAGIWEWYSEKTLDFSAVFQIWKMIIGFFFFNYLGNYKIFFKRHFTVEK